MKITVYNNLFDFYDYDYKTQTEKANARQYIRRKLKKLEKTWENLDHIEQVEFKYFTVKDYFLKNYSDLERRKKEAEIKEILNKELYETKKFIQLHNKYVEGKYKPFYDPKASDEENQKSYQKYCEYSSRFFPNEKVLDYEELKKTRLRLYDLEKNADLQRQMEAEEEIRNSEYYVSEREVDQVVIKCLLKFFEDYKIFKINRDDIKRCLYSYNAFSEWQDDLIPTEYDPNSRFSEDEQKEEIDFSISMIANYIKLEKLDFIEKLKNFDEFTKKSK